MSAAAAPPAVNTGLPAPRYRVVPAYATTDGPLVAEVCRPTGLVPDPLQQDILDAIFGYDEDGNVVAFETGIIACRQNIKTSTMEMAVIGWVSSGVRLVIWSSHRFKTSGEAFRDMEERLAADSTLRRRVKRVWRGSGNESIEMRDGARVQFQTRSKSGAKGLTGNKVVLDEAFALEAMQIGALLPTMSTLWDPQLLYGSSAGYADSEVLRDLRDRGREPGSDPQLAYFEWCAPDPEEACAAGKACTHGKQVAGCGCDKPEFLRMANPAMFDRSLGQYRDAARGWRISLDYIRKERRAMPVGEFGRERMGWWDDPAEGVSPISTTMWERRKDAKSTAKDPVALAVAIALDRSSAAIAACGYREDFKIHAEVTDHRAGTDWVLERLLEMTAKHKPCVVVIDPTAGEGSLEKELTTPAKPGDKPRFAVKPEPGSKILREGQTQLYLVTAKDYGQACGGITDDIANDGLRHLGQKPLDDTIPVLRTRDIGDGAWAWSAKNSTSDIQPMRAVTLARQGLIVYGRKKSPPEPFVLVGR